MIADPKGNEPSREEVATALVALLSPDADTPLMRAVRARIAQEAAAGSSAANSIPVSISRVASPPNMEFRCSICGERYCPPDTRCGC